MSAEAHQTVRIFKVGRRVYRKVCKRDRRRHPIYAYPELKLSNAWLWEAGLHPGDRVAVRVIEPGCLVVVRVAARGVSSAATSRPASNASEPAAPGLPIVRL